MLIGITGGIGSGKTTVVKLFSEYDNIAVYFADEEAKRLMVTSEVIKNKIIDNFSKEAYLDDELNRAYLSKIVFNDTRKLKILNSIVHPVVFQHLQDFRDKHKEKDYILYENAILFENGSDSLCDKIITVTAPIDLRIKRVIRRDNTSEKAVKSRIKNQWKEAKKTLQSNYIIQNLILTNVKKDIGKIHNKLTKK